MSASAADLMISSETAPAADLALDAGWLAGVRWRDWDTTDGEWCRRDVAEVQVREFGGTQRDVVQLSNVGLLTTLSTVLC